MYLIVYTVIKYQNVMSYLCRECFLFDYYCWMRDDMYDDKFMCGNMRYEGVRGTVYFCSILLDKIC